MRKPIEKHFNLKCQSICNNKNSSREQYKKINKKYAGKKDW